MPNHASCFADGYKSLSRFDFFSSFSDKIFQMPGIFFEFNLHFFSLVENCELGCFFYYLISQNLSEVVRSFSVDLLHSFVVGNMVFDSAIHYIQ